MSDSATPWVTAHQASLSITNSWSSLKLTFIESVMQSSHLILCRPLLLLPPIPPSSRVFSNESTLRMRWPKYWSFSFSIIPFKEHPGLISSRMDFSWISLQSKGLSGVFSNTTVQKHQFLGAQLSSQSNSHIHTWPQEKPYIALTRRSFVGKIMSLLKYYKQQQKHKCPRPWVLNEEWRSHVPQLRHSPAKYINIKK